MRYRHPRKTPDTPMYMWLEWKNRNSVIEELNHMENVARYWWWEHEQLKERFFATPMQVYWDSFKETFPDTVMVSHKKIKDDIVELKKDNDKKDAEIEKLQTLVKELENVNESVLFLLSVFADKSSWIYETIYDKYGEEHQWVWTGYYSDPQQEAIDMLEKIKKET